MRNISRWILVIFLLAVAGFLFYAFGSFTTSSDHTLAVKQLGNGSTVTLKCTQHVTHRSNFFWGLSGKTSERLQFYVVTNKRVRTNFTNNELGGLDDAQYGSVPGTDHWVGAYDHYFELVVFIFDGSGKVLEIEKLNFISRFDRPNHDVLTFKIIEKENSVVYLTKNGCMKYNYVDKTKSRYEGTLE